MNINALLDNTWGKHENDLCRKVRLEFYSNRDDGTGSEGGVGWVVVRGWGLDGVGVGEFSRKFWKFPGNFRLGPGRTKIDILKW